MLTRVVLALMLGAAVAATASAEDAKIRGLGLTDHVVTDAELEKGDALPPPRFNTPGVAYVWASGLKKGDTVDIILNKEGQSLMRNSKTLAEDEASFVLMAGKSGVPAGGWPEGSYNAEVKISRDGKTLLEEKSKPMAFE
jgi:NADPH:quinone reductase-like Zn-dependent oxidoreductase